MGDAFRIDRNKLHQTGEGVLSPGIGTSGDDFEGYPILGREKI
jgi:hypothetical protein